MSAGRTTPPPSARPPGASRYGWFVGVVAVLVLTYIAVNTLRTGNGVAVTRGEKLPPFAVPELFAGGAAGGRDANVANHPCRVKLAEALVVCAERRPLVLALASVKDEETLRQLDAMQRVAPRFPRVHFVGVFLRGDRGKARADTRKRGWSFPLGWDRQGDVAAVYGVRALPVLFVAASGRSTRAVEYRVLDAPELARRLRRLR